MPRQVAAWHTGWVREGAALAAVLALALVLRLLLLESRWINPDEGAHLMDGRLILDGLVPSRDFIARQVFYVHVLAFVIKLAGNDIVVARLLPVFSAMGAGVFLYFIARRLFGATVALLALVLFLLLPFSVLMTVNVKTQPLVLLFSVGGMFFAVRGVQGRDGAGWPFLLSGVFLGLAYYVRESSLAVALAAGVLLLAVRPAGRRATLLRLAWFAGGLVGVTTVVILYYLRHAPLATAFELSYNPIAFVLENLRDVGRSVEERTGAALVPEVWVGRIHEQPYSVTLANMREVAYFHLFLIVGAVLSLPQLVAAFRGRVAHPRTAFWCLVPWLGLMVLAYGFWSVSRSFFQAYFLELLPPLCILTAAVVVAALAPLRARAKPATDVLVVVLLLGLLAVVHSEIPGLHRPLYFVIPTLMLGAFYLRGDRPVRWVLLAALVAGASVAVVFTAPRLGGAAPKLALYAAFACAVYWGIFRAAGLAVRGSVPRTVGFVAYSLVISAFTLSVFASAPHLDLAYDCVWSSRTLREVTALLRKEARSGDEVMSGAVIWEFESNLRPFRGRSHPLGYIERMSVTEADAILARFETGPPAFVILDGFTELTYLRHLPQIHALLESRYELRAVVAGSQYPVRVFALRRARA